MLQKFLEIQQFVDTVAWVLENCTCPDGRVRLSNLLYYFNKELLRHEEWSMEQIHNGLTQLEKDGLVDVFDCLTE